LLTIDGLEGEDASNLHEHLRGCPGCRAYWKEIGEVCQDQLGAAASLPEVEAGGSFHRRLQQRLTVEAPGPARINGAEVWSRYFTGWRVAFPLAAIVALGLVLLYSGNRSGEPKRAPIAKKLANARATQSDSPPSLSAYRVALTRSFEEFDELLNRNSTRLTAPAEPVIVAALGRMPPDWP
jgi:hypothetical protein